MAIFFVLGPTHWKAPSPGATPMAIRRRIARRLEKHGHLSMILEDVEDRGSDQDLVDTFYRALDRVTDVLVYHPPGAKMQATLHELLLMAARPDPPRRVWLLVHPDAAELEGFQFTIKETGLGSRYLDAVHRLRPVLLPWRAQKDLYRRVNHVATEV